MKKMKTLISSLIGVTACLAISVGATYALFTSDAKADIAITAGKVSASAEINNLTIYSANPDLTSGEEVPGGNELGVYSHTYYYEDRTAYGTFIDGGTASLSNGNLSLNLIAPGDMVKAKYVVTNNSNVDVKYRFIAECTDTDDDSLRLFSALRFTALGETKSNVKKYYTNWASWTADDPIRTKQSDIKIEMPITLGNFYQNLSTHISLSVQMVQANAYTVNDTDEVLYFTEKKVEAGSTPSGMDDILLKVGGTESTPDFKAYIPTGTVGEVKAAGDNVKVGDSLTLVVKEEPIAPSIVIESDEVARNYEIHVINQDNELITSLNKKIKVYVFVGEDSEVLRVYHKNVLVPDYKFENGYVIYETSDFSPFTVVLFNPDIEATIDERIFSSLRTAIETARDGETVVLHRSVITNETYSIGAVNGSIDIDLGGHTVTVNNSTVDDSKPAFLFTQNTVNKYTWGLRNGKVIAKDNCYTGIYVSNGAFEAEDLEIYNSTAHYFGIETRSNAATYRNVKVTSSMGGGFYGNGGCADLYSCTAIQSGFDNHVSTGLAAANGGVLTAHDVTVNSENYGAFVFSSGGTITLYRGAITVAGDKEAVLAGSSDSYTDDSKVNVIGTKVSGKIGQGSKNATLFVYSGSFNNNPTNYKDAFSTITGPDAQGYYTVSRTEGTTVLVYDDSYNHNVHEVNKVDVSANDKLISGDYALSDSERTVLVEEGYTYIGGSFNGFITKTKGSNASAGSVVALKITRNTKTYTIYYSSLEDCLDEASSFEVTSLTLRQNCTYEGDLNSAYSILGSSYTLTVKGTVTGGSYGCKIAADAVTGGSFGSNVSTPQGMISGGSFSTLPYKYHFANDVYISYVGKKYVVTKDVSSYNVVWNINGNEVYGYFDDMYLMGTNLRLVDDVTTTNATKTNNVYYLNGHTFTLNNADYSAVTSKDSNSVVVVSNSLLSEGKLSIGSYYKYAILNDYPLANGVTALSGTSANYIVRSDDVNGDGKLYKGVYSFSISGVFPDQYSCSTVKDQTDAYAYIVGKNVETLNNKIISGTFHMDPSNYVLEGKTVVTETGGIWTVTPDESKAEAKIGDKKYLTINAALTAATSGQTVTLLSDVTTNESITFSKNNLTLDLDGHTLTASSTCTELFVMSYTSSTFSSRVCNGTIVCSGLVGNASTKHTLNLNDVNVACTSIFTRYYKALKINSGVFNQDVSKYVASGSSCEKVGDNWVVTVNAN